MRQIIQVKPEGLRLFYGQGIGQAGAKNERIGERDERSAIFGVKLQVARKTRGAVGGK